MRHLLILFIFLILPSFSALAEPPNEVTYVLFSRGWPPLEMTKDNEPLGAAVDIFKAVMSEKMVPLVEIMPRPRKKLYTPTGPVYTRLEAKEWLNKDYTYWWSEPVLTLSDVLISSPDSPVRYSGPRSLEGKTIGCITNYQYPKLDPLFKSGKATRYNVNKDDILLRMVMAGRVECVVMDKITAEWIIHNNDEFEPEDFHFAIRPVDVVELRFAFNRIDGWDAFLPEINRNIRGLHSSGKIVEILSRYR